MGRDGRAAGEQESLPGGSVTLREIYRFEQRSLKLRLVNGGRQVVTTRSRAQ
jgi:hypothetical protein